MDIQEAWNKALKQTAIIRSRVMSLKTFGDTHVPYIFLAPSSINSGDTVVRQGEILVDRPSLILPPNIPQLEGFDLDESTVHDDALINFLFVRGITMPSLKYNNKTHSLDIFEGSVEDAISHYGNTLQRQENVTTGLLAGPEDVWQYSVLIFICAQIGKNATTDIKRLLDEYKRKNN